MFDFTESQMISCAATNLQHLDKMQDVLECALYPLDVEYNETMGEMVKLITQLRTTTLRLQYDAEIAKFTELRNQL
jgi:hypothetical protein